MMNAGLKLEPKAADLYLARGVLYVQIADYEKAEADFEKAEELRSASNPERRGTGNARRGAEPKRS